MSDIALINASAYAAKRHLRLLDRLGFGIHGTVHVVEDTGNKFQSAIKASKSPDFYFRELAVYHRLRERGVTDILGFHVPQLIRADDHLLVLEMTIVTKPFLLDFAGAHLEARPEFTAEVWTDWEAEKCEQFGTRWRTVQGVIDKLEAMGIYLVDVSPSNIRFLH